VILIGFKIDNVINQHKMMFSLFCLFRTDLKYLNLNQAPWSPPGWFFGAAWTTIMICFSIYMAYLFKFFKGSKLLVLFGIQFVLNVIWNYIFFNQHLIGIGLIVIVILTIIVGTFLTSYYNKLKIKSLLIVPYFLWLLIATSLNAYIYLYN
jgi:tryptophan-rich sensory protein